jgi:hypothetical protein
VWELEEVSPLRCKGWSDEGRPPGIFNLVKRWKTKDSISRWNSMWAERSFIMSYFRSSILASMVECMEELMVEILALIFRNSFWVMERSDDKALKCDSRSWLWVWAMVKGGHRKGVGGST